MKYDQKTMTPDNFLVNLQTLAKRALSDPVPQPVAPLNQYNDQDRFDRENCENQNWNQRNSSFAGNWNQNNSFDNNSGRKRKSGPNRNFGQNGAINSGPRQPQVRTSYNARSKPLRGFDAYGNKICYRCKFSSQ